MRYFFCKKCREVDVVGKRGVTKGNVAKDRRLPSSTKAAWSCQISSVEQIVPDQFLQKIVPINFADQATGVVEVCDVCGVLREQITDNLVDGIVTFLAERTVNGCQNLLHFRCGIVRNHKFDRIVVHVVCLLCMAVIII